MAIVCAAALGGACGGGADCIDAIWIDGVRYDNEYRVIDADQVGELLLEVADSGCSDAAVGPIKVGHDADESVDGAATVLSVGTPIHEVIDEAELVVAEHDGKFEVYKRVPG